MKFVAKELGTTKPFFVKTSNKNMLKTVDFQLAMAGMSEEEEDLPPIELVKKAREALLLPLEYVRELLPLTKKQAETLDDLEQAELMHLANRLALSVQGLSEKEIDKALSSTEDEEKK